MHHTDFKSLSILYLYGELSGRKKQLFEEHLDKCEGCRKEFDEMKETLGLLKELPTENPAPDLRRIVLEKATAHRDRKRSILDILSVNIFKYRKVFRVGLAVLMMFIGMFMIISYVVPGIGKLPGESKPIAATPTAGNGEAALTADLDGDIDAVDTGLKSAEMESRGASDIADMNVDGISGSKFYPQFANTNDYGEYMSLKSEADDIVKMMRSF